MRATNSSSTVAAATVTIILTTTLLFSFSLQRRVCVVDGLVLPPSTLTLLRSPQIRIPSPNIRCLSNNRFSSFIPTNNSHDWGITSTSTYNMKHTTKMMHHHTSSTSLYSSSQQGELSPRPSFLERDDGASTLPQLLESLWGLISHASQAMTRGVS